MLRSISQPLDTARLVGWVRATGADVDLAGDRLVNDDLFLLIQQRDQLLLGPNVAPDASVGMIKEADDGDLLSDRRNRNRHRSDELPIRTRHLRAERRAVDRVDHRFGPKRALDTRPDDPLVARSKHKKLSDANAAACRTSDFCEIRSQLPEQDVARFEGFHLTVEFDAFIDLHQSSRPALDVLQAYV